MCLIFEFYVGLSSLLKSKFTMQYYVSASLKFKIEFIQFIFQDKMLNPSHQALPANHDRGKWKKLIRITLNQQPFCFLSWVLMSRCATTEKQLKFVRGVLTASVIEECVLQLSKVNQHF